MSQAKKKYLINSFSNLGTLLSHPDEPLRELIEREQHYNAWFTPLNTLNAVKAIGTMLNRDDLELWSGIESSPDSYRGKNQESRGFEHEASPDSYRGGKQEAERKNQEARIKNQELRKLEPETGNEKHDMAESPTMDYGLSTMDPKKVGLILAGNIPLVGFHDVLCVLASGHHALIKASTQDARLIKYIFEMLVAIAPEFNDSYTFVDRLAGFDAVIATGSNNTSRYFEYYFGKVPNIIRKNRNSVGLLTGSETDAQLFLLGHDIFDFFGLGCRNVSKLLVPVGYDFTPFFEAIEPHQPIIHHHKYNNNYDYNKSIYLVNGDKHLDNGFLLVKEDERMASPLAVLYFEYYKDLVSAQARLSSLSDNIQCIVTSSELDSTNQVVPFGKSQQPKLWDYADGVDTMAFLTGL